MLKDYTLKRLEGGIVNFVAFLSAYLNVTDVEFHGGSMGSTT